MSGNITLVYTASSAKLFQDFNLTEGRHSKTSSRPRFATFYFRKKMNSFIMSKNIMTFYAILNIQGLVVLGERIFPQFVTNI